jgi:chemotaxis protein MotB
MATFSDLMNLLLCFFVLLFSMSSVDEEKFDRVIESLKASLSVLQGSTSMMDGTMVGEGVMQIEGFEKIYIESFNSSGSDAAPGDASGLTGADLENAGNNNAENTDSNSASADATDLQEQYEEMALKESEEMAEQIQKMAEQMGIDNQVEIDFNSQYVVLELSGALLFDSGSADVKQDAYKLLKKVGTILTRYENRIIEIEGHTDNVPMSSGTYANNEVLSTFRAMNVADYLMDETQIDPVWFKYSGRGEYVPVADNSTAEGRAKNRRVEIKLYNSFSSKN